jgi:hypothetical protein
VRDRPRFASTASTTTTARERSRAGDRAVTSLRIIANRPNTGAREEYARKLDDAKRSHHLPTTTCAVPGSQARRRVELRRRAARVGRERRRLSRAALHEPGAFPTRFAGLLLDLRDRTDSIPHAYFGWTEGNPIAYLLKFLAFGEGDTAPVTREVLRQAEPIPDRAAAHSRRLTACARHATL